MKTQTVFVTAFLFALDFTKVLADDLSQETKDQLRAITEILPDIRDRIKALEDANIANQTEIPLGGAVKKISYSSGNGPNDGIDDGRIVSRALRFSKIEDNSTVRISYSDNLRVTGDGSKACRWVVKVNGTNCSDYEFNIDKHDGRGSNNHSTSTLTGYCTGLKSGWHTVNVWVSPVPSQDNRFANSDCWTGWNNSLWTIEATELTAVPHKP